MVDLSGNPLAVAQVKALTVSPGLWILIPCLALAGATGNALARLKSGRLETAKKNRMAVAAGNGLLVLVPCALVLNRGAAEAAFGTAFYTLQGIEVAAGSLNLVLLGLNFRDGLRLSGRCSRAGRRAAATEPRGKH